MRVAIDAAVRWGGDMLVQRRIVRGPIRVGDADDALCAIPLPEASWLELGVVVEGQAEAFVPAGVRAWARSRDGVTRLVFGPERLALDEGDLVKLKLGAFQVELQGARADTSTWRGRGGARRAGVAAIIGSVAVAHLALLGAGSVMHPPPPPRVPAVQTSIEVQRWLAVAEARDQGEAPPTWDEREAPAQPPDDRAAHDPLEDEALAMCEGPVSSGVALQAYAPARPAPPGGGVAGGAAAFGGLLAFGAFALLLVRLPRRREVDSAGG